MIRYILPGVILGILLAGCAPQVIHEEMEYRKLIVQGISPEKDSFLAQDIATARPAPLRVPEQIPRSSGQARRRRNSKASNLPYFCNTPPVQKVFPDVMPRKRLCCRTAFP